MSGSTLASLPRSLPPFLLPLFLVAACGGGGADGLDASATTDGAHDLRPDRPATPRLCLPPPGVSARPRSIAETVALVNALPRPVTVACLLEALERPLYVNATRSFLSLQPAVGSRSPRLFLMFDGMSASVVPDGTGSKLIEFGEFVTPERTLKAELKTPVTAEVQPGDPYKSPITTTGADAGMATSCRICHVLEERHEAITFADAYVSNALRPDPRSDVSLETVIEQRDACPDDDQGERCTILRALLDHGPVLHRAFPETLPTIFD
jgi:hypothetical protein